MSYGGKKGSSSATTQITNNPTQPYVFAMNFDTMQQALKLQAKDRQTKDTFYTEISADQLRNIGFYQNMKGFYNRLRMALESKCPNELRAYYWFYTNDGKAALTHVNDKKGKPTSKRDCMAVILEERSRFDDESTKWCITLKPLDIKDTVKLSEKLEDVQQVVTDRDKKIKEQLNFIVQQVKQKFVSEKESRQELEKRVVSCENAIKKLGKMVKDVQSKIDLSHDKVDVARQATNEDMSKFSVDLQSQMEQLTERMKSLETQVSTEGTDSTKRWDELRPKLARLKNRRDFTTEQGYIEYIIKKLEDWDKARYGPILVRVNREMASGKAKHFMGYVGEPVKWNTTICKVQWFGLGKQQPESVKWSTLDVYLPLSAYYYPDCPHAQLPSDRPSTVNEKL